MDQNNGPSKIVFESEEFQRPVQSFQTQPPKIVRWVMQYSGGYIKDEKRASYVLIGFVAVAIILSVFFIMSGGSNARGPIPHGTSLTVPG